MIMETITMEEKIMVKTVLIISLFHALFSTANLLILCTILGTILSFALKWLFGIEFSILLLFGIFLVIHVVIVLLTYPFARSEPTESYLSVIVVYNIISPRYLWFIDFGSLYAARGEANKCLDLLRLATLNDPAKKNYSCTHGSCTAIVKFGRNIDNTNNSAAEGWIDLLAKSVALPDFIGTTYQSMSSSGGVDAYASLHCRNSWGGIAQWIAKRHLSNSTQDELAPSDTTPLLR